MRLLLTEIKMNIVYKHNIFKICLKPTVSLGMLFPKISTVGRIQQFRPVFQYQAGGGLGRKSGGQRTFFELRFRSALDTFNQNPAAGSPKTVLEAIMKYFCGPPDLSTVSDSGSVPP